MNRVSKKNLSEKSIERVDLICQDALGRIEKILSDGNNHSVPVMVKAAEMACGIRLSQQERAYVEGNFSAAVGTLIAKGCAKKTDKIKDAKIRPKSWVGKKCTVFQQYATTGKPFVRRKSACTKGPYTKGKTENKNIAPKVSKKSKSQAAAKQAATQALTPGMRRSLIAQNKKLQKMIDMNNKLLAK